MNDGAWPGLARWAGEFSSLTAGCRGLQHDLLRTGIRGCCHNWSSAQKSTSSSGVSSLGGAGRRTLPVRAAHTVTSSSASVRSSRVMPLSSCPAPTPVPSTGGTEWCRIIRLSLATRCGQTAQPVRLSHVGHMRPNGPERASRTVRHIHLQAPALPPYPGSGAYAEVASWPQLARSLEETLLNPRAGVARSSSNFRNGRWRYAHIRIRNCP